MELWTYGAMELYGDMELFSCSCVLLFVALHTLTRNELPFLIPRDKLPPACTSMALYIQHEYSTSGLGKSVNTSLAFLLSITTTLVLVYKDMTAIIDEIWVSK